MTTFPGHTFNLSGDAIKEIPKHYVRTIVNETVKGKNYLGTYSKDVRNMNSYTQEPDYRGVSYGRIMIVDGKWRLLPVNTVIFYAHRAGEFFEELIISDSTYLFGGAKIPGTSTDADINLITQSGTYYHNGTTQAPPPTTTTVLPLTPQATTITESQVKALYNARGQGLTFYPDTSSPLTSLYVDWGSSPVRKGYIHSIWTGQDMEWVSITTTSSYPKRQKITRLEIRFFEDGTMQLKNLETGDIGNMGTYIQNTQNFSGIRSILNMSVSGGILQFLKIR